MQADFLETLAVVLDVVVVDLEFHEILFVVVDELGGLGFGERGEDGFVVGVHDVDVLEVALVLVQDLVVNP